ncbi:MAG: ABC transporter permease [Thermoplasmatota archaeon]
MALLDRAARNAVRNPGRTIGVASVVAIALGIFLILSQLNASVVHNAAAAESSVQNLVSIQQGGGHVGGGHFFVILSKGGIPDRVIQNASATPDVVSVQRVIAGPINGPNPGANSGGGSTFVTANGGGGSCGFGPQYMVEDVNAPLKLFLGGFTGADPPAIIAGRTLGSADDNQTVALVGEQYASDNNLTVGQGLSLWGTTFAVVGVYSGVGCAGDAVLLPYESGLVALQASGSPFLENSGPTVVYVNVDSYRNVPAVTTSLQAQLGTNYTVTNLAQANHQALQTAIDSVQSTSQIGQYGALAVGAGVTVATVAMVTSRRVKELGLMKAIGYRNAPIIAQISVETMMTSLLGLPVAVIVAVLAGPSLVNTFFGSDASGRAGAVLFATVQYLASPELVAVGAGLTILFGVLGSLYPSYRAIKLEPTEALRDE